MTMNTENIPTISNTEVIEVSDPDALNRMLAELTRLQAENKALRERPSKSSTPAPDSLPQFASYDASLFASIDDVAVMLHKAGIAVAADDVMDARYFVKLTGLRGQAQVKDSGVRGRGKLLYLRPEVSVAIAKLVEIRP